MAVDAARMHDGAIQYLLQNSAGKRWDDSAATFAFILVTNAYTPSNAHSTYSQLSANECADSGYVRQAVASRALSTTGAYTYLQAAAANFGSNVTLAARYLVCIAGTAGSLQTTDRIIFRQDLNQGGSANVSSSNSNFSVSQPTSGWLSINQP